MMKKVWSIILLAAGWALFTGMADALARMWVNLKLGIDVSQYFTPHFDRFVALEPILGAIFLVGGLILWYLPRES